MPLTYTRYIKGHEVTLDDWRDEIMRLADVCGPPGATLPQIAWELGPPYSEGDPDDRLRQILRSMVKSRHLANPVPGHFQVIPGYQERPYDIPHGDKLAALSGLRHYGGMAFLREIVWLIDGGTGPHRHRVRKDYRYYYQRDDNDLAYQDRGVGREGGEHLDKMRRALKALVAERKVEQRYDLSTSIMGINQAGLYNLPDRDCVKLPVWGWNTLRKYKVSTPLREGKLMHKKEREDCVDASLSAAARAARYARLYAGLTIPKVLRHPPIAEYMPTWRRDCSAPMGRLAAEHRFIHGNDPGYLPLTQKELDARSFEMFENFESLNTGVIRSRHANLCLEPSIWTALGDLYGVNGAMMSRGIWEPKR